MIASFFICGFAAYRLTRLFTTDTITEPLRRFVYHRGYVDDGSPRKGGYLWRVFYLLNDCEYCAGFWITLLVVLAWKNLQDLRFVLLVIAAAGLQYLLSFMSEVKDDNEEDDFRPL